MIDNPSAVEVELTSKCTLFCPECPRTKDADEKMHKWKFGELPIETFEKFIQTSPQNIIFSGAYGDPIYHSKFIEIMDLCRQHDKQVVVNTNGSYRNSEWWEKLASVVNQRTIFVFSVDGIETSNHIYRINADWPSILTGMRIMSSNAACSVEWKWIVFRHNENDIEKGFLLSKELGIDTFTIVSTGRPYPDGMEPTVPFDQLLDKLNMLKEKYSEARP